jgi:hypothetical protein
LEEVDSQLGETHEHADSWLPDIDDLMFADKHSDATPTTLT